MSVDPTLTLDGAAPGLQEPGGPEAAFPARYEDLGLIGMGATGAVHRVRDRRLGATFAMKVLRPNALNSPPLRARFLEEARLMAKLRHPGLVAVQDLGELEDGRPWFTMEEVRGRTLAALIEEVHAASSPGEWGRGPSGATFRGLVEPLARACQAIAFAHSVGVLHRDLKPANLMIGAFGELRVMDWGLACTVSEGRGDARVLGTLPYLAPELARGEGATPLTDVYALGATLFALLNRLSPFSGKDRATLEALGRGLRPEHRADAPPAPAPLRELCDRAMDPDPQRRLPGAAALAEELLAWLEGTRRRAEAVALVEQADQVAARVAALREAAEAREARAFALLDGVQPHDPLEKKLPAWRLQDEARAQRHEVRLLEVEYTTTLGAALTRAPELNPALDRLADHYRRLAEDAERSGAAEDADAAAALVRAYDRGRYAAWLRKEGTFSLITHPPGARARLMRFQEQDRRLREVFVAELRTPITGHPLPVGSYILHLELPGHTPARYPIQIERAAHWDGVRPGDTAPTPIRLWPAGSWPERMCYVPAGWFTLGGDPKALDGVSARRIWADGFLLERDPVTVGDYLAFLNDLARAGRGEEAQRLVPTDSNSSRPIFRRDDRGQLVPGEDPGSGQPILEDEPLTYVTGPGVEAYLAWWSDRSGLRGRLPDDAEWEKAARGVDARAFPWGNTLDPTWCRMQHSLAGGVGRAPVGAYPTDLSPYGLRGLAGNVRERCANAYARGGPEGPIVQKLAAPPEAPWRMLRGGSWSSAPDFCRLAGRFVWRADTGTSSSGFRVCADLPLDRGVPDQVSELIEAGV